MTEQPLLGKLLVFGAGAAVVGVRIDADAATGREEADDLDVLGIHESDEILHDDVHAVFMEIAVVAEREEIQFQTLRLHHPLAGEIHDLDLCKVGLTRDGAKRRKLGAVELHPVVILRMFVLKRFQHLRGIVHPVLGLLAERLQPHSRAGLVYPLPFILSVCTHSSFTLNIL